NISGCDLSSDILVSLMDRDKEMKDLFICNQEYFDLVKQSIFGASEEGWQQFLEILYAPRRVLSDSEWISTISEVLDPNPHLLAKFKEIVGYYVCMIRDYPKILENLETSYPQFFVNVNQFLSQQAEYRGSALGGNHLSQARQSVRVSSGGIFQEGNNNNNDSELSSLWKRCSPTISLPLKQTNPPSKTPTLYDEFKSVLLSSRSELSDEEWEMAIYEYLDPWPQLAAQFEEIISYEIGED
ncbi:728_t:CDS:2, partial [Acaulospora morrowiae]